MIKILIKIFILGINIIYSFIKLFPVKNRVTFISRQSNEVSFEFQMIKEEIDKRNIGMESVFLCHTLDGGYQSSIISKIKYGFHMFTQMYYIATSKVVILDTYCIVISLLKHKKNLKVIQMWHSIGTMKKFGYQILDLGEGTKKSIAHLMKMHQNYDYVFCAGEGYRDYLAQGFGCSPDIIKIFPLPRVDLLQNQKYQEETKKKIYGKYPQLSSKPTIVYVPTFRKDETRFIKAVDSLMKHLDQDYHFVIKVHPLSKLEIKDKRIFTCEEFSSSEMLSVADYVISDYSCIIYEAAIMNKPIYLYDFDIDEYNDKRGLNIDLDEELPGCVSQDFKDIMNSIKDKEYDFERLNTFRNKYVKETRHATKDIVDFILSII